MSSFFEEVPQPTQRGFTTLREQVASLRELSANPIQRIPTGLKMLDHAVIGVGMGEMFMFAARAGSGKSAFATQFIANNPDTPLIFFSLEMPAPRVTQRLFCQVSDYNAFQLEMEAMSNHLPLDLEALHDKLPYSVVVDRPGLRWADMKAYVENYADAYGMRPKIILIDYLELIGGMKSKGEIDSGQVAAAAQQAKEFAVEEKLGVILLHQLNMSVKEWEPPNKGSLRYGGLAEADFVVGLWRPGTDPELNGQQAKLREREVGINVLKNRIFGREPRFLRYKLTDSMRLVDLDRG